MATYTETDPRAIEQEVDRERARVADTIDALQSTLSTKGNVDEVAKALSAHGGAITDGLGRAVRDNPLPLILTGIGLTWLMASSGERRASPPEFQGGSAPGHGTSGAGMPAMGPRVSRGADATLGGLRGTFAEARDTAAHTIGAAGEAASGAGSRLAGMASGAAGTLADAASGATTTVNDGLEAGAAQARAAADWGTEHGRQAIRSLGALAEEQPLVLGAIALAIGAAIGGALPRTRTEDSLVGAPADRVKAAAMDTVKTEGQKVAAVAGAVATEAAHIAEEAGDKLAEAAGGLAAKAMEASTRLRGAAQEESEAQKGEMVEGTVGTADRPALAATEIWSDVPPENDVGEIDRRDEAARSVDPTRG